MSEIGTKTKEKFLKSQAEEKKTVRTGTLHRNTRNGWKMNGKEEGRFHKARV